MRFAFTDEQLLFRDTVRDLLAKHCPPEVVRAAWEDDAARGGDAWQALAEVGLVGLTVPEDHGGLGLGELDWVLALEETGRAALPDPVLETVAVGAPLLAEAGGGDLAAAMLSQVAAGEAFLTVGLAPSPFVAHADVAALCLLERDGRLLAAPPEACTPEAQPSVDGARRQFSVAVDPDAATVLAEGDAAAGLTARAFDRGALAAAAQLVGLAQHLLDVTVDYVGQREQFGVPVGSFQAVKHHLADATLQVAFARPVVHRAAYALAHGEPTAGRDVSMAKCLASRASSVAAAQALQCHGAIGYTVEYDLHLWLKRVWALGASWGDAAFHRARVGAAVLPPTRSDEE